MKILRTLLNVESCDSYYVGNDVGKRSLTYHWKIQALYI